MSKAANFFNPTAYFVDVINHNGQPPDQTIVSSALYIDIDLFLRVF